MGSPSGRGVVVSRGCIPGSWTVDSGHIFVLLGCNVESLPEPGRCHACLAGRTWRLGSSGLPAGFLHWGGCHPGLPRPQSTPDGWIRAPLSRRPSIRCTAWVFLGADSGLSCLPMPLLAASLPGKESRSRSWKKSGRDMLTATSSLTSSPMLAPDCKVNLDLRIIPLGPMSQPRSWT